MIKQYFRSLSGSGFQIIVNQVFGLVFFALQAVYLQKDAFGNVNWAVAVSTTVYIFLTFGFDHIVVRNIASGSNYKIECGIYSAHTLIVACIAASFVTFRFLFFHNSPREELLLVMVASFMFTYLSFPYRQLANSKEKFWALALMNVCGNIVRTIVLLALIFVRQVNVRGIELLYFIAGIMELTVAMAVVSRIFKTVIVPVFSTDIYKKLVKQALPQMGVVLLDSTFARMDWILMGVLSTSFFTADYSFAYKAFESSRIPLLIIAPILLPKVAKAFGKSDLSSEQRELRQQRALQSLRVLWRIESVLCVLIPLALNSVWVELINIATHNKYGLDTRWSYAVLSLSLPFIYMTNFFWTIIFSSGRVRLTFRITLAVTLLDFLLNIILIPHFQAVGAAFAFTFSSIVQFVLYSLNVKDLKMDFAPFIKSILITVAVVILVHFLPIHWLLRLLVSGMLYLLFAWVTGLISRSFVINARRKLF